MLIIRVCLTTTTGIHAMSDPDGCSRSNTEVNPKYPLENPNFMSGAPQPSEPNSFSAPAPNGNHVATKPGSSNEKITVVEVQPPGDQLTPGKKEGPLERQELKEQRRKPLRMFGIIIGLISLLLLVLVATLAGLYAKEKGRHHPPPPQPTGNLSVSTSAFGDVSPVTDTKLGALSVILAEMFASPSSSGPKSEVVYNGDNGQICIRVKSGPTWRDNVQCVEGANPLPNSPITILDWLGGPSIYFFTADHILSGIDHIPQNNSWRFSSVTNHNILVHNQSQIASLTWLNGTSAWIYYQDPNEQIREFGIDDYRDSTWRDGSWGPLGRAQIGSGIGVARWLNGTDLCA